MKLSEPQKRVLRTMLEFDSIASVLPWGRRWDISTIGGGFRPRLQTLRVLVRLGFLQRDHIGNLEFEYYLTSKGRAVAKELRDTKALRSIQASE